MIDNKYKKEKISLLRKKFCVKKKKKELFIASASISVIVKLYTFANIQIYVTYILDTIQKVMCHHYYG